MTEHKNLSSFRKEYVRSVLNESDVPADPLTLFNQWLDEAIAQQQPEPNAMTLATVKPGGRPAARVVLLKEVSEGGFVFYTNYESAKGQELEVNPHASLVFLWLGLQRQVRVNGWVKKVSPETSDAYFAVRPRNSQIGALVSPQSIVICGREELEQRFEEISRQASPVGRPPYWGGYRLIPDSIEFWQGRESRLHDRLLYTKQDEQWHMVRLAP